MTEAVTFLGIFITLLGIIITWYRYKKIDFEKSGQTDAKVSELANKVDRLQHNIHLLEEKSEREVKEIKKSIKESEEKLYRNLSDFKKETRCNQEKTSKTLTNLSNTLSGLSANIDLLVKKFIEK